MVRMGHTYPVTFHLGLVLLRGHLIPVQDNLGVGRVPDDVSRRLARSCNKKKESQGKESRRRDFVKNL